MATEKRHKPLASNSKSSSLIIQLPSTSATSNLLAPNNTESSSRDLEQNNLFGRCSAGVSARNQILQAVAAQQQQQQDGAGAGQVTRGGGGSLLVAAGAASSQSDALLPPPERNQQYPANQLAHHHRNHLNNFHNHIHQHQHRQPNASNQRPLAEAQNFNDDNESDERQPSVTPPPNYHEIPGVVPAYQGRSSGPPPAYDDVVNPNALPPTYQSLFGQVREARKTSNGLVDLCRQLFLVLIGTIGCTMIIGFLLLIPITMILIGLVYVNDCRAESIPSLLVGGGSVWIVKNVLNCYNQFKKDSSSSNRPPPRRQPISSARQQPAAVSSSSVLIVSGGPTAEDATSSSSSSSSSGVSSQSNYTDTQRGDQQQQSSPPPPPTSDGANADSSTAASAPTQSAAARPSQAQQDESGTRTSASNARANHIRHPPMIGITSYKCESILNYFLIVWFLASCIVVYRIYEPDYENPASANYCHRLVYLYAFWLVTSAFIVVAIILSCLCCLVASSLMSCGHRRR